VFSIDLMSAYHHVPLAKEAWPFMGFAWKGRFYYFRVLPFGLAPAPMVFAKITGVMVEHWRTQGAQILPYLDNFLGGSESREKAKLLAHMVLEDMTKAGWLVAATKVKLEPTQASWQCVRLQDRAVPSTLGTNPSFQAASRRCASWRRKREGENVVTRC
jgi:hypothetical protein